MTIWRPRQHIRPIVLAAIRRADAFLVVPVPDDGGATKGWRFLGGGIEFGERAHDALRRELREEIGATAVIGRQIAIIENIYEHHGVRGHEIVFVHEAEIDDVLLARETIDVLDDEVTPIAHWVAVEAFATGRETLLPDGLLAHLTWQVA